MDDATRQALSRERIDILAGMVLGLRAELAQALSENARLRAALETVAQLPVGACHCTGVVERCNRCNDAHDIARAALEVSE